MENKETKLCKHCQTEIPKKAKVCPNCRKKQSSIGKWIAIVVVLLLLGSCFGSGNDNENKPSDRNPKSVSKVTESIETKEDVIKNSEEQKKEFNVGDIVETSYLKISYISAEEYTSDNQFIQPKDGNVYYKIDFEFENISDSDQYVSSWDFSCYADGYDMEQTYLDGMDLDATLSSGKKTKGAVFFEVPKNAEEIVLEYETNYWTEDKVVFVVK